LLQCKRLEQQLLQVYHHATPPLRHLNALEATAGTVVRLLREQFPEAPPEDYGLISFLTMAAVDSTSSLLANALAFLSRNEALQDRLCARPEFINGFITEMLRYWPPLKRIQGRRATTDIELGGRIIPRGATLTFDLVAAHFDASAYPEPERFDIDRKGPPPLAFGGGPHMCLGAALTRVEGRSFLEALCRDWIVRPAGEPRRAESPDFSDFDSVPIRLDAR
jgi:cytochrome P450